MQQNRFSAFSDSEGDQSEEEQQHTSKQNRPIDPRSRAEKRKANKDDKNVTHEAHQIQNDGKKQKSAKEQQKQKGVPAEPHPLDRHSGSNVTSVKPQDRKGGAGKGNWGTMKDDLKELPVDQETQEEVQQATQEEEQLTLQEYLALKGVNKVQQQKQQTKGNQDYTSFLKEGCQVIEKVAQVDDKNPTKKKATTDKYIAMQNSELLGFRTGIKTYALREERPRDDADRKERAPRQPREQQKEEAPKQEGEQTEQQQDVKVQSEQREDNHERKPYRNNRDGDNRRQNKGEYKGPRGPRGPRNAPQKTSVKVNLEDDSLFPKLG